MQSHIKSRLKERYFHMHINTHTCPAALRTKCTPHTTPQHTSPRHVTTRCESHWRCTGRTHSLRQYTLATVTVALPSLTVVLSCFGCRRPSVRHLTPAKDADLSSAAGTDTTQCSAPEQTNGDGSKVSFTHTAPNTVTAKQLYNSPP